MKTQTMSIVFVLIVGLLALVPNVSAVGYMDGANWTSIDNIWDSLGMSYLKNSSLLAGSNVTLTKYANGSVLISANGSGSCSDCPNATVASNLANWNATYNATYDAKPSSTFNSTYDSTTLTVNGNLANWNATYNSSYNTLLTNAPNSTVTNNLLS